MQTTINFHGIKVEISLNKDGDIESSTVGDCHDFIDILSHDNQDKFHVILDIEIEKIKSNYDFEKQLSAMS